MRQTPDMTGGLPRPRGKPGDFTADRRVLVLIGMALVVGSLGAGAAWVLLKLIALVTNLVWFGHLSTENVSLASAHPGDLDGAGAGARRSRDRIDGAVRLGEDPGPRYP
jgi:hypothetical protein